jgi:polysaccharide transporter, PST family
MSHIKIIDNAILRFLDRFSRMRLGLFVGVWIARYPGMQQFGLLSYAAAFVALFNTLSDLGLSSLAVRSIANEPDQKGLILGKIVECC